VDLNFLSADSLSVCKGKAREVGVSASTTIQRYLRAVQQHDYGEVIACFAEDAAVVHPIFGRQPAASFFQSLFAKTAADKLTVKTIFHCSDNPATAAVLFFDEWRSAHGTEFKNDIVLIFDFGRDDRVQNLTVVFDTFPVRGKL
jgi:ketosteroid isomerase-like protein